MSARRLSGRLIVVWLLLGALLAVVLALEYRDRIAADPTRGAPASDARLLLPVPVAELGALEVTDAGTVHRFERDPDGTWFYHGPHGHGGHAHTHRPDPAMAARIEQGLAAFGRTRIERQVGRAVAGQAYGVTAPRLVILAYRRQEPEPLARYAVGDVAPDTFSRYVDTGGAAGVVTIPTYQVDNLLALIEAVKGTAH